MCVLLDIYFLHAYDTARAPVLLVVLAGIVCVPTHTLGDSIFGLSVVVWTINKTKLEIALIAACTTSVRRRPPVHFCSQFSLCSFYLHVLNIPFHSHRSTVVVVGVVVVATPNSPHARRLARAASTEVATLYALWIRFIKHITHTQTKNKQTKTNQTVSAFCWFNSTIHKTSLERDPSRLDTRVQGHHSIG